MIKSNLLSNRMLRWCVLVAIPSGLYAADRATPGALPSLVHTADAVVYIDQNRALAGAITPSDAPGFPVTISQSGNYRLSGNLTVSDADTGAIQITADFVTLDLNGFSIAGPVTCTTGTTTTCPAPGKGIGIQTGGEQAPFPRGVRILNGSVRGMGLLGILANGSGSSVERMTVDSNAGGGMSVAGTVIQSAATQNGAFGIIADTVRDSTVLQNAGDGIILGVRASPRGQLILPAVNAGVATGNVSSLNGGDGIVVPLGTVTGNTFFLNQAGGILASCPSSIVGNTIVSSGTTGIQTTGNGCALANNGMRQ